MSPVREKKPRGCVDYDSVSADAPLLVALCPPDAL